MSFIQREISMSMNLVILGRPPSRALFNVKSRTLRVLTTAFLLMETILSPWRLLSFFFEQDARTYTNSKTRYELKKKNLLWGTHIPPPHLEFAKLQVYGVQVSFSNCSSIRTYRGVVDGVAHIFVGVACPSFFLIFP